MFFSFLSATVNQCLGHNLRMPTFDQLLFGQKSRRYLNQLAKMVSFREKRCLVVELHRWITQSPISKFLIESSHLRSKGLGLKACCFDLTVTWQGVESFKVAVPLGVEVAYISILSFLLYFAPNLPGLHLLFSWKQKFTLNQASFYRSWPSSVDCDHPHRLVIGKRDGTSDSVGLLGSFPSAHVEQVLYLQAKTSLFLVSRRQRLDLDVQLVDTLIRFFLKQTWLSIQEALKQQIPTVSRTLSSFSAFMRLDWMALRSTLAPSWKIQR